MNDNNNTHVLNRVINSHLYLEEHRCFGNDSERNFQESNLN